MAEWIGRKRKYQEFVGFEFNGIHSSQLNLYRVSDGSRYNEDMSAAFQDKTVQAPGRDGIFYFGTNYTQRTFNIQIAFDSMTEDDMHEFRRIFAAKEEGYLIFDETNYKKYKVKIQTPPQLKYICFDAPVDPVQESDIPSSVSYIKNGKINYTFGSTSNKGKIYKGEGTIQFVAYYPFAVEVYKYLANYNNQNSKNLIPQNYYSPQTRTSYGVTFEKREDADNYGAVTMNGTHSTKGDSYYIFAQYTDPIEIATTATYYLNPTISNDFKYIVSQINPDGTRTRAMTASTNTIVSKSFNEGDKVYIFLMVPKASTVTFNNSTGFFPVFTSNSADLKDNETIRANDTLHSYYPLKGTSISTPYAKYIGYYDWKGPSRMKDAKMISDSEANGSLYFDTTTVITTTEATSQVIDSTGGNLFKQGDSVVKLYNAGEIDSDLIFYTTARTDTTNAWINNDFLKRPTIIQLIKHTNNSANDVNTWEVVEQLTLEAGFSYLGNDYYMRYNSKTNLLEGGVYNSEKRDFLNFPFEPTGNIYNRFITSGNFFKVPAYEEGVTYYLRATSSTNAWNPTAYPTSLPTTWPTTWEDTSNTYHAYRCIYSTIKYNHVWY